MQMNLEIFERLEMDVTQFDAEDIITTSGIGGGGSGGGSGSGSSGQGDGLMPVDYEIILPVPGI